LPFFLTHCAYSVQGIFGFLVCQDLINIKKYFQNLIFL